MCTNNFFSGKKFSFALHEGRINTACVTHDDHYLVTAGDDMKISIWSLEKGKCEAILLGHTDTVKTYLVENEAWHKTKSDNK